MEEKRIQLTLFADGSQSGSIEAVRREFNPLQYELIKAHVTLCREDELRRIEKVISNLSNLRYGHITIDFGKAVRFSDGKGVLIPAIGDLSPYQNLRESILTGVVENLRQHEPHITLMHPRNSTCTDEIFEKIKNHRLPNRLVFRSISLIEQKIGKKWHTLQTFELMG